MGKTQFGAVGSGKRTGIRELRDLSGEQVVGMRRVIGERRTGKQQAVSVENSHPSKGATGGATSLSGGRRAVGKRTVIRNCKRRGEWAELVFMARAAEMGLETLRVSGDSAKYDVVVEAGGRFGRVQVKSTMCRCGRRSYACAAHPNQRGRPYRRREFDFLAAYVIPEDVWYIIPTRLVVHGRMGGIILSPGLPGHKWERYMEAWELLKSGARLPEKFKIHAQAELERTQACSPEHSWASNACVISASASSSSGWREWN